LILSLITARIREPKSTDPIMVINASSPFTMAEIRVDRHSEKTTDQS
jgi:hypothetical protein